MSAIITWQPVLRGLVIRSWEVDAANGDAARMMIEAMMLDERAFSLMREWQRGGAIVQPRADTPNGIVPGGLTG
jgi:hypothetical protein